MFDRDGCYIVYKTEADMLAILKGDRLDPKLRPVYRQHMVVDAASWGWNEAIQYMVDEMGFCAHDYDDKNYTPLGFSAMKGHLKTVKMLVEDYKVDVKYARNNEGPHFGGSGWFDGNTALDYALEHQHYHIVRFLIDHGAEVDDEADETVDDILERANAELKKQAQQQWATFKKAMRAWTVLSFWMMETGKKQYAPGEVGAKRLRAEFEEFNRQPKA